MIEFKFSCIQSVSRTSFYGVEATDVRMSAKTFLYMDGVLYSKTNISRPTKEVRAYLSPHFLIDWVANRGGGSS